MNTSWAEITKDDYEKITPEQRKKIVQEWEPGTDLQKLQKNAILYEAKGDFKTASLICEEILSRTDVPDEIIATTHIALQRYYEKLNDMKNEKKEVGWINDNVLSPLGKYNYISKYFTETTLNHLEKRKLLLGWKDKAIKNK